jgi:hypothetical protein
MPYHTPSFAFLLLTPLALSSCATVGAVNDGGINVALGQTTNVSGPKIRPITVIEDSRCPINARCIWAGRVRVKVLWLRVAGNQELELTLGEAQPMADGAITLVSVTPERRTEKVTKRKDYRFSFEFAGGL